MPASYTSTDFEPNSLLAKSEGLWDKSETIQSGQTLLAGSVLGKITANSELVLSNSSSSDGSEIPYAILPQDIDTTAGAIKAPIFLSGYFIESSLIFGAGHTVASTFSLFRNLGIKTVKSI